MWCLGKERESHGSDILGFEDWSVTVNVISVAPEVSEEFESTIFGAHVSGRLDRQNTS